MSKVDFYYLNLKGLGEGARLLLSYGGQEFVDHRIEYAELPKLKSSTPLPFGQLPMLVIDGKQYAQSNAICRYLGKKYGLAGDNAEEDFEIDQNLDYLFDIWTKGVAVIVETDPEIKEKKFEDLLKNTYPSMMEKLNEIIVKNNGHIAAGKLTWADFVFTGVYDYLSKNMRCSDLFAKYPSFKQLVETIYSLPKVKAFADSVPSS